MYIQLYILVSILSRFNFMANVNMSCFASPASKVSSMFLCTPVMDVNLWGESPLYENQKVFIC